MPVTFLGYQFLDFINNDSAPIKGIKFYFYFPSEKANYKGFEVASYFADYVKERILYDMVQKCIPGEQYVFDTIPSFSGKTKIKSINPIK